MNALSRDITVQPQGIKAIHGLMHPTPAHVQSCVMAALHDMHDAGQHIPPHVFQAIRKGVAKANREHDAGVL